MKKNKKKLSIQKVKVVELKKNQVVGGLVAREGRDEIEGDYSDFCGGGGGGGGGDDGGTIICATVACNPISLGTIRNCGYRTSGCFM